MPNRIVFLTSYVLPEPGSDFGGSDGSPPARTSSEGGGNGRATTAPLLPVPALPAAESLGFLLLLLLLLLLRLLPSPLSLPLTLLLLLPWFVAPTLDLAIPLCCLRHRRPVHSRMV